LATAIDASGHSSKAPLWLTALGYMPWQETKVNSFLGYASRVYQRPPELQSEWQSPYESLSDVNRN
jgi:hypothetical protein